MELRGCQLTGSEFRDIRRRSGLTQSQAAEMLGVSRATVYGAERSFTVKRTLECASLALGNRDMVYRYMEKLTMAEYILVVRRQKQNGIADE
jgi:DNA-binding XRE family transcriptional regulator